jgi:phage-related protein
VFEVALKYRTDAFRTVYALQLGMDVWVLHAFQKKAKAGIKAPKKELELVRDRLKRLKKELRQ